MRASRIVPALTLLVAAASCDRAGVGRGAPKASNLVAAGAVDESKVVAGQTIYVPAYSHIYSADNAEPLNLAITLFVRNTDPERPIILTKVGYHDSKGRRVRELIPSASRLDPLASAEFFIGESDASGGASPSFLVEWVSEAPVSDPLAESAMIRAAGAQGITFAATGRVIRSRRP